MTAELLWKKAPIRASTHKLKLELDSSVSSCLLWEDQIVVGANSGALTFFQLG